MLTPNSAKVESSQSCKVAAYEEFSKSFIFEFPWQLGSCFSRRHLSMQTADSRQRGSTLGVGTKPYINTKKENGKNREMSQAKRKTDIESFRDRHKSFFAMPSYLPKSFPMQHLANYEENAGRTAHFTAFKCVCSPMGIQRHRQEEESSKTSLPYHFSLSPHPSLLQIII